MSSIIKVENVSKRFVLNHEGQERYTALRDVLTRKAASLLKGKTGTKASKEEFWALKDISFEIEQGDRVGIIGRNGAGKSTLLKILSRITDPSSGRITIGGRVASLLEVGTGFHPELTGRENIFLNGAILGMSRAEIRRKFDEIVDFAEVEKFLDTPVKRYSSGMYVRLAFAVAAHLEPEILVVDEVLAVGDEQFQKKCIGKMGQVSKEGGRTVFFVSHNIESVTKLCNRGILLDGGKIIIDGYIDDVVDKYRAHNKYFSSSYDKLDGIIRNVNVSIEKSDEGIDDFIVSAKLSLNEKINQPVFGVVIKDLNDNQLIGVNNKNYFSNQIQLEKGYHAVELRIPNIYLSSNLYKADIFFGTGATDIDYVIDKIFFNVDKKNNKIITPLNPKINKIYVKEIRFEVNKIS